MDEFLSGIRSFLSQPSRPAGARRVSPTSIAQRAPELVARLVGRESIGRRELASLTQNLTPAQKKAVAENLDAFRSYFRQARRSKLSKMLGTGISGGTTLAGLLYPMVRRDLPLTGEAARRNDTREMIRERALLRAAEPTLIEAAQEFNQEQEDLRNLIGAPNSSRRIGPDLTLEQIDRQTREEDFARRVRATERALDPFPGSPRLDSPERDAIAVLMAGDEDDVSESPVEDVASVLEAMVQDLPEVSSLAIRDRQFVPRERPLSSFEKARFQRDRRVSVPYAGKTRYDLDIPDHMRETAIVSQPLPRAVMRDMIKPRRRLQPTSPGTFGEFLDESITDFQGAPMMSEREILRMLRGE